HAPRAVGGIASNIAALVCGLARLADPLLPGYGTRSVPATLLVPRVLMGDQERREIARHCWIGRVREAELLKAGPSGLWLFIESDEREEPIHEHLLNFVAGHFNLQCAANQLRSRSRKTDRHLGRRRRSQQRLLRMPAEPYQHAP